MKTGDIQRIVPNLQSRLMRGFAALATVAVTVGAASQGAIAQEPFEALKSSHALTPVATVGLTPAATTSPESVISTSAHSSDSVLIGVNCLNHTGSVSAGPNFAPLDCDPISLGGTDLVLDPPPAEASNLRVRRLSTDLTLPERSSADTGELTKTAREFQLWF